jgi:hypothetical protein
MKNYRIKLSVILLFVFSTVFYAQELKHNQSNWFAYVGQYNVSKKWGIILKHNLDWMMS